MWDGERRDAADAADGGGDAGPGGVNGGGSTGGAAGTGSDGGTSGWIMTGRSDDSLEFARERVPEAMLAAPTRWRR